MALPLPPDRPLAPPEGEEAGQQLNPFVFPSETRGRFWLLVIAALVVGLNLAQVAVEVTRGKADRDQLTKILERYGGIKTIDPSHPDTVVLGDLRRRYADLARESLGIVVSRLAIPALTLALLTILGVGIYLRHPQRVRRRHHPRQLSLEQAPEVVGYLRRCADRMGIPWLQVEYEPAFGDGQAYGLRGRESLLLFGTPALLEKGWQKIFKLIALHELGHVVNHDAAAREKASAVWRALLIVLVLALTILIVAVAPGIARIATGSGGSAAVAALAKLTWRGMAVLWPLVVLLLVVRLIQAGIIRSRELYADWRVASWGFGDSLDGLLRTGERRSESWWQRWWELHPSSRLRREVLANPRRLFQVSPALAFITGILFMVVFCSAFAPLVQLATLVSVLGPLLAGRAPSVANPLLLLAETFLIQTLPTLLLLGVCLFAISYLVTAALGVQVQRAAVADLADGPSRSGGYLRLLVPALLFSFGMETGQLLSPFSPLPTIFTQLALLPVWFGGFTFFTWLWLVYVRAATRLSLGVRLGSEQPRFLRVLILFSAALLLAILYLPALLTRVVLMIKPESLPPWLTAGKDPWEQFVYTFAMTPMMFAVFAVIVFLVWAGTGLTAASFSFLRRSSYCPTCSEPTDCGFSIGRFCSACGRSLASWAYLKPPADPGCPEPE